MKKPSFDWKVITLDPIAIAMPPPAAARRRNRRGRARKSPAFHVSVPRDWADLPLDAVSCILHKLDVAELLLGGVAAVCRSWRRAAREEPELWRRIDVRSLPDVPDFTRRARLENVTRSALRLSAGQCHTFCGQDLDDDLFMLLAESAPSLKSLQLTSCNYISYGGFANAIRKLPLLEELQFLYCLDEEEVLQLVAKVCRRLKHFMLVQRRCHTYRELKDDRKAFAIAKMHELRFLVLDGDNLSNEGLTAIIDNCHHLEYLSMSDCCNIIMDGNLTAKCAGITMNYHEYFPPSEPCSCCMSPMSYGIIDVYDYDDYHDHSLYSYLGDAIDAADFEEYERILDVKGMRRYLS